jgi:hypothetical protein
VGGRRPPPGRDALTGSHRLAILALVALLQGCGGGAQELLDTARLEETQRNVPHARELYEEIVRRFPGTPEAETAAARLRALSSDLPR